MFLKKVKFLAPNQMLLLKMLRVLQVSWIPLWPKKIFHLPIPSKTRKPIALLSSKNLRPLSPTKNHQNANDSTLVPEDKQEAAIVRPTTATDEVPPSVVRVNSPLKLTIDTTA